MENRLQQGSVMSQQSAAVQRLASVQQESDAVTKEELKSALKKESERWSERCMGEISNFECVAAEQRRTHEAALEKTVARAVEDMAREQISLEGRQMKTIEEQSSRLNSQILDLRKEVLSASEKLQAQLVEVKHAASMTQDSIHSLPERESMSGFDEMSVRSIRGEIEVCRAELKTTMPFVKNLCDQNRQSTEHAESLISDLRQDLNVQRDEHMAGIEGLKASQKDLRRDFSDLQRSLTQSVRDLERTSSKDVNQCVQDLRDLVEASAISSKADLQAEVARLHSRSEADRTVEMTKVADIQQLRDTIDGKVESVSRELAAQFEFKMEESLSRRDELSNSSRDAQSLRISSIESVDERHQKDVQELRERLITSENSMQETMTEELMRFSARLSAIQASSSNASAPLQDAASLEAENTVGLAEDVAAILARLDILEHQASSAGIKVGADEVALMSARLDMFELSCRDEAGKTSADVTMDRESIADLRKSIALLNTDVSRLSQNVALAPLAEDVATKGAEYMLRERERSTIAEEAASKAAESIQQERDRFSKCLTAERAELENVIAARMKVIGNELRADSSEAARRISACEARLASSGTVMKSTCEASMNSELKRISGDLGTRVSQIESNILQSAQLGLRFRTLEVEVKRTSSLVSSLLDNRSKKGTDVASLDSTQPSTISGLHQDDDYSTDSRVAYSMPPMRDRPFSLASGQLSVPAPVPSPGLPQEFRVSSGAASISDGDHPPSGAASSTGEVEKRRDMEQLLNAIKGVRECEQATDNDPNLQGASAKAMLARLQSILSKESSRMAVELTQEAQGVEGGSMISDGLKETLGNLVDAVHRTLGPSNPSSPQQPIGRDAMQLQAMLHELAQTGGNSASRPATSPDKSNQLASDMEYLLHQLSLQLAGNAETAPDARARSATPVPAPFVPSLGGVGAVRRGNSLSLATLPPARGSLGAPPGEPRASPRASRSLEGTGRVPESGGPPQRPNLSSLAGDRSTSRPQQMKLQQQQSPGSLGAGPAFAKRSGPLGIAPRTLSEASAGNQGVQQGQPPAQGLRSITRSPQPPAQRGGAAQPPAQRGAGSLAAMQSHFLT